jgi:hypothetical protein
MSAVEMLRNEPHLSAAELAQRAGVKISYAKGLVRRQRSGPAPVAAMRPIADPVERVEVRDRAQIMNASTGGLNIGQIADQFGLMPGEVEFALKIGRLAKKA